MGFLAKRKARKAVAAPLERVVATSEPVWVPGSMADRVENVKIDLWFDAEQVERDRDWIAALADSGTVPELRDGDSYHLTVDFEMTYHNVALKLKALRMLLQRPDLASGAHISERDGLEMLLVGLVDDIRAVQASLSGK